MKKLLLTVLLFAAFPASADDAEALARLKAFTADLHTLRAEFTQTVLNDELETVRESSGSFLLRRPGKFRWNYETPFEQVIVGDGTDLWTYDPELEQATVKPMAETLASSPASLLTGTRPIEEEFIVRELGPASELYWIELMPRVRDTDFERVRVALNQGRLDTMELQDNLGQTTRIRFRDLEINVDIEDGAFRFTPPEGADVIGEATPVE